MSETILITGATGFVGQYVCRYLRSLGTRYRIVGVDIRKEPEKQYDEFYVGDITDIKLLQEVVGEISPHYIFHLAGTFGAGETQQIYKVNMLSMTALLETVRECVPDAIVVAVGSAAEYGVIPPSCLPVTERQSCNPITPYGVSKNLATQVAEYYYKVHGVKIMIVRPFQLVGKGLTSRLAPGAFAKRLIEAKEKGHDDILVGNLESSRDFIDVHDAVRAIWLLCQKPFPGEVFNICSGKPVKLSDLVEMMIDLLGGGINTVTKQEYLRGGADVDMIYGSFSKIQAQCGWIPEISLRDSLASMLNVK